MKIQKCIIIAAIPICIVSLIFSFVLEFGYISCTHVSYCLSVLLGIFASGLLIIVTAFIGYWGEKEKYYKNVFLAMNDLISNTEYYIRALQEKDETFKPSQIVPEMQADFKRIKIEMWNYSSFCKPNHKDKVIGNVVVCISRIIKIVAFLYDENDKRHSGRISETDYMCAYDTIINNLVTINLPQLLEYKAEVDTIIDSLVRDRKLDSLIDKGN